MVWIICSLFGCTSADFEPLFEFLIGNRGNLPFFREPLQRIQLVEDAKRADQMGKPASFPMLHVHVCDEGDLRLHGEIGL